MQRLKKFLFTNTSNKQTVVKNGLWLLVGEFGSRVLKLGVFMYAARALGVIEWGMFSYGLALMGTFSIFSDIGMNAILLREVSKKSDLMHRYISTGFYIKGVLSVISSILVLTTLFFIKDTALIVLIPLVALMLFIDSMREFGYTINRSFERMEVEAGIKIVSTLLLAIVATYTLFMRPDAQSLMVAYIFAGILSLILLYATVRKYTTTLIHSFDRSLVRTILIESWPIGIIAVFGTILSSIDTLLLGWLTDTTQVGYYAAAQKPLQLLWLVPSLMATALLPFFSRSVTNSEKSFAEVLGRAISIALVLILPLVLLTILLARPIILILFGTQYISAIPLLQIIAVSAIATIPSMFISNALIAYRKQKMILQFIAIGAVSNIILSLILIPHYGMYGAALSFTISQIIANACMLFYTRSIPAFCFSLNIKSLSTDIRSLLRR